MLLDFCNWKNDKIPVPYLHLLRFLHFLHLSPILSDGIPYSKHRVLCTTVIKIHQRMMSNWPIDLIFSRENDDRREDISALWQSKSFQLSHTVSSLFFSVSCFRLVTFHENLIILKIFSVVSSLAEQWDLVLLLQKLSILWS